MTRYYSEIAEYSQMSTAEYRLRCSIVAVLEEFTREMENYSYFGSNPGISEQEYEDVAEALLLRFNITDLED